jgi:uncharacterized protein (TIGR03435 family)
MMRHAPMLLRRTSLLLAISLASTIACLARTASVPDWQTAAGGKQEFDVASVRPNNSGRPYGPPESRGDAWRTSVSLDPEVLDTPTQGILSTTNTPLISLMSFAYKLSRVQQNALQSSLPEWVFSDGYNVEARTENRDVTREQMRPMMRSLLEERFKIKVHYETREVPVYAAVLVKPGTFGPHMQLHPADSPCSMEWPPTPEGGPRVRPNGPGVYPFLCGRFTRMAPSEPDRRKEGGRDVSISTLGLLFFDFGNLDRPVIDGTGIKGTVDFVIEFSPQPSPGFESQAAPSGPPFDVALRQQLGLKLVPQKAPFPFLVVDHVERPSGN